MGNGRPKRHKFSHFITPKTSTKDKGHRNDLSMQAQKGNNGIVLT
jgi:hypothetical protein